MPNHVFATFRAYPEAERWEFTQDEIISILTAVISSQADVEHSDRYGPFVFGPGGNVIINGRNIPIWTLWRKYEPRESDVRTWAETIAAQGKL